MIYVRQSTANQVVTNQESLRLQYALRQRASDLGWDDADIEVVDVDLGLSGSTLSHREGFKDVIARVTLGEVGIILSYEVTRLARNCTDWYPLLDLCGFRQCLIGDRDGIYDPGSANGRLLLGLKGTISEVELHTLRGRLTAGLLNKAKRGELALLPPAGLERDTNRSRPCCAITMPNISETRRAGYPATVRRCSRASSGAGNAVTRWRYSTRMPIATSVTICCAVRGPAMPAPAR
ncbi:recombinase family protein [Paraburkholderia phytofirmans]